MSDAKRAVAAIAILLTVGCGAKLQPHVSVRVPAPQAVDLFWWTDTRQCEVRVLFRDYREPIDGLQWKSFTLPADQSLCLAWLKAEGWDISGVVPKKAKKP